MAQNNFISINTNGVTTYIKHLQTVSYREMNNGVVSLVRQSANDIKAIYKDVTPKGERGGKSGKYGATAGNLKRSLRVFKKRQTDPMKVEFTVGYKVHESGELAAKVAQGKRAVDGYYGWMVNYGEAGNTKGKGNVKNTGFIQRARKSANTLIELGLSQKSGDFIKNKLQKIVDKQPK